MDGLSISQVAELAGFPPTTLRFYEQAGHLRPNRTPAGCQSYDQRDLDLVAFIGRAEGFGLALDDIAELLAFTAELDRVAASLGCHTADGPCDVTCGCTTDRQVLIDT